MADPSLATCLAAIKKRPGQFYVYMLYRPDGRPFYVGCGRAKRIKFGERLRDHETEARAGRRSVKHSIIRKIWDQDGQVIYAIDSWHNDRDAMEAREIELIALIGRRQLNAGPLANRNDGGGRGAGAIMSTATRRLWSIRRKGRKATEETKERIRIARAAIREVYSERQRANWADPNYRARVVKNMSGKSPPIKTRKKLTAANIASWKNPEHRAKRTATITAALQAPEYRERQAKHMSQLWQDPKFRMRMIEARRVARMAKLNLTGD